MTTKRIELTENYQEIAVGAFLLQVVTPATVVRIHIGNVIPDDGTGDCHYENSSISYPGTQKAYARAHTELASVIVTEVT